MNLTPTRHVPHELLIRLASGASLEGDVVTDLEADVLDRFELKGGASFDAGDSLLHLRLPESTSTEDALEKLADDPRIRYAVPNHIFELDAVPSRQPDDLDPQLWGMKSIHAPEAWAVSTGSSTGPIIAVLDTGVDLEHPDLKANLWTNPREIPGNGIDDDGNGAVDDVHGYNPHDNSGNIQDGHRHGTHTAGTIGAVGDNGRGVVGVNWQAQIMPIKIFDDEGRTSASAIIKGLEYANKMGARITSNSWGGSQFNPAIRDAFASSSALHIAAAGNRRQNTDVSGHYPSAYDIPNMISVAATAPDDSRASFSNYGPLTVDLAAPGKDILSTVPGGGTEVLSGTSMACPHVAGVAALIATVYPSASNDDIKNRLLTGTDKVEALRGVVSTGGRLNAANSLESDPIAPSAPDRFTAQSGDARSLTLTWEAPGDDGNKGTAAFYDLRVSEKPITDDESFELARRVPVAGPRPAGSRETAVVPVRPSGQEKQLYLALRAADNVGNVSGMVTTRGTVRASRTAFQDTGASGWSVKGDWARDGEGVWASQAVLGSTTMLASPPISLKGMKNATLVFDSRLGLSQEDVLWIQVSRDGGDTWKPVGHLEGKSDWQPQAFDLSAYDGKQVQFQFNLVTRLSGEREGVSLKAIGVLAEPR